MLKSIFASAATWLGASVGTPIGAAVGTYADALHTANLPASESLETTFISLAVGAICGAICGGIVGTAVEKFRSPSP